MNCTVYPKSAAGFIRERRAILFLDKNGNPIKEGSLVQRTWYDIKYKPVRVRWIENADMYGGRYNIKDGRRKNNTYEVLE